MQEQAKGFCQCGCGRRTNLAPQSDTRNGWVRGEPIRWIKGHHMKRPVRERFWAQTNTAGLVPDYAPHLGPCWLWVGTQTSLGYGRIYSDGKQCQAHRVGYELLIGPIPEGLDLDHLCRVPACVNPAHLEPVTHRENMRRGRAATKTHCPHGHSLDDALITKAGHRRCRHCDRERCLRYYYARKAREAASPVSVRSTG